MPTFVEITPTKLRDSPSTIRAAIQPCTALPIPGFENTFCDESVILSHLSKKGTSNKKWKNPKGLFGYSKDSEYKDLYAYFDYGDQTSPINELATKALAMYGLGGAMGEPNWGSIRGTVILERIEPDYSFCPDAVFNPNLTVEEIYDTLVFFRDAKLSTRQIATKRDSVRTMRSMGMSGAGGGVFGSTSTGHTFPATNQAFLDRVMGSMGGSATYFAPTGETRKQKQVDEDQDRCDHCGKMQSLLGQKLKKCAICQVTFYCGRECQKAAWKTHKKVCKSL